MAFNAEPYHERAMVPAYPLYIILGVLQFKVLLSIDHFLRGQLIDYVKKQFICVCPLLNDNSYLLEVYGTDTY